MHRSGSRDDGVQYGMPPRGLRTPSHHQSYPLEIAMNWLSTYSVVILLLRHCNASEMDQTASL